MTHPETKAFVRELAERTFADISRIEAMESKDGEWRKSVPVNPLLARAMYLKGYIEKSGTGTEDMIAKCKEWGVPAPEWTEDDADDFRVVLKRPMAEPSVEKALRMSACGDDRGLMESGNHSSALPVLLV